MLAFRGVAYNCRRSTRVYSRGGVLLRRTCAVLMPCCTGGSLATAPRSSCFPCPHCVASAAPTWHYACVSILRLHMLCTGIALGLQHNTMWCYAAVLALLCWRTSLTLNRERAVACAFGRMANNASCAASSVHVQTAPRTGCTSVLIFKSVCSSRLRRARLAAPDGGGEDAQIGEGCRGGPCEVK